MKTLAIALLLLFVPTVSMAAPLSGNDLHKQLERPIGEAPYLLGYGEGFVAGIADALTGIPKYNRIGSFCIPQKGVEYGQVVDVVKKYLEDTPERRHFYAFVLVKEALQKSFPCKK